MVEGGVMVSKEWEEIRQHVIGALIAATNGKIGNYNGQVFGADDTTYEVNVQGRHTYNITGIRITASVRELYLLRDERRPWIVVNSVGQLVDKLATLQSKCAALRERIATRKQAVDESARRQKQQSDEYFNQIAAAGYKPERRDGSKTISWLVGTLTFTYDWDNGYPRLHIMPTTSGLEQVLLISQALAQATIA